MEPAFADPVARAIGARIVAPDRPGIGGSDPDPKRTISGWAQDARGLVEYLGIQRLDLLAVSGGAPYALACAATLEQPVGKVTIVSGLGPPEAVHAAAMVTTSGEGLRLAAVHPEVAKAIIHLVGMLARNAPSLLIALLWAKASRVDGRALAAADFRGPLAAAMREGFTKSSRGAVTDLELLGKAWDFELAGVEVPVHLWHGMEDTVVPVSVGRFLERSLPHCRATYLPGHGHYSLIYEHVEPILRDTIDGGAGA